MRSSSCSMTMKFSKSAMLTTTNNKRHQHRRAPTTTTASTIRTTPSPRIAATAVPCFPQIARSMNLVTWKTPNLRGRRMLQKLKRSKHQRKPTPLKQFSRSCQVRKVRWAELPPRAHRSNCQKSNWMTTAPSFSYSSTTQASNRKAHSIYPSTKVRQHKDKSLSKF